MSNDTRHNGCRCGPAAGPGMGSGADSGTGSGKGKGPEAGLIIDKCTEHGNDRSVGNGIGLGHDGRFENDDCSTQGNSPAADNGSDANCDIDNNSADGQAYTTDGGRTHDDKCTVDNGSDANCDIDNSSADGQAYTTDGGRTHDDKCTVDNGFETGHKGRHIMLYFGSFNPVHRGHIAIAEYAVERGAADMVVLVVSPQNPFKEAGELAPEFNRYEMTERAAASSRYPDLIQASAVEMTLPRPSYTIDTLRYLESEFPEARFSILMGGDNVGGLEKWREADRIIGRYDIFVYPRPGETIEKLFPRMTVLTDAPQMEISSTKVRALLESGRTHYRAGEFGAAANDFRRARELSPWDTEAEGYLDIIDDIHNFRNTDLLNP